MKDDNDTSERMANEAFGKPTLMAKIRKRTEVEQDFSATNVLPPYSAAALGQAPYVAIGNGAIIVQRRCNNWNC